MFEWDSVTIPAYAGNPPCARRTDTSMTLTDALSDADCSNDEHCVGQVWSGALWQLRGPLGTDVDGYDVMDSDVVGSNFLLPPNTTFTSAAQAVLDADAALYPDNSTPGQTGAHQPAIHDEFEARGICSAANPDDDC
jgi:hypothetical protein